MKALWMFVGILVVLLVVGYFAWSVGASRALDAAIEDVGVTYRLDTFPADYPARDDSTDAAWRVDEAAGRVGLHVIPMAERTGVEPPGAADWDSVKGDIGEYVSSLRSSADDTIPAIPESVAGFLDAHAGDLDEIEALLVGGEQIRFASRLDRGADAPLPNLRGQLGLTRLLATRAMASRLRGDDAAAWRSLEAVYRLESTLSDQPILICRLISLADLNILAAAARRMNPPFPEWVRELEATRPREEHLEGMRGEMYFHATLFRNTATEDLKNIGTGEEVDALMNPLGRPIFLWDAAYTLRDIDRLTRHAMETDPCTYDPATAASSIEQRPLWASVAIMMPEIASTFTRANQTALAIEGTRVVLDLKENPESFTARPSSVCSDESWVAERQSDGSIRVTFTGRIIAPANQPASSLVATEHVIAKR